MADLHDLQTRAGHLERTFCESDDQHGDLLSGLRDGLSTVHDRLIQIKLENDRLAKENAQLKQIIEQLLGSIESKSRSASAVIFRRNSSIEIARSSSDIAVSSS